MSELLLELGCEELPARFVPPTLEAMRQALLDQASVARLDLAGVRILGTPRRLTLAVDQVASAQRDLEEERLGPPEQVAYKDGQPTKAALGFAKGQGVGVEDLYVQETPKGRYVAAKVFEQGLPAQEVLPGLLNAVIAGLSFPKSMRWSNKEASFARPVRWILAMHHGQRVHVEFGGVQSALVTYGHRFSAPDPIEVTSIAQYIDALRQADVLVDPKERAHRMQAELERCAKESGGALRQDDALAQEVLNLVEKPHGVLVRFDQKYLKLPDEVLISSMRKHQRYFSLTDPSGALIPACAVIYNTPVHDPQVVRAGNLRVLKARLDDAKFFWEQDAARSLESLLPQLESVIWVKKLGTMGARVARMETLAKTLATLIGLDPQDAKDATLAARLSKADLLTHMVSEFPDLQGVVGREYALRDTLGQGVATAIHEQYLPRGADDTLPTTDAGALVALAERLDTLAGLFGIGLHTSGTDPYGLRRAASGVLRILQSRAYTTPLRPLITAALDAYTTHAATPLETPAPELQAQLLAFFHARLKSALTEEFGADVVDAVLAVTDDEVLTVTDRVRALHTLRQERDFESLAVGFKRVVNILRKQADEHVQIPSAVDEPKLQDPQEIALWQACQRARPDIDSALETRDWLGACRALITLKAPIDAFFDHVMVMTDDQALKLNRLALLDQLRSLFLKVADISGMSP